MQKINANISGRKRFLLLLGVMTLATTCVGLTTLVVLYNAAFQEQKARLVETAQSRARFIESVARFDAQYSQNDVPGGSFEATLMQLREAHTHFKGFGKTGEFTVAKREKDQIVFLLSHRHYDLDNLHPVPFDGKCAEPMRRALMGQSGTVVGWDYRDETVLAAYEPVAVLDLGIVAKIDLSEIREPFIRAGILAGVMGVVLVLLGSFLFFRIGFPLLRSIEESEKKYRTLFQSSTEGVAIIGDVFEDCNEQMCHILGCDRDDLIGHPPGGFSPERQPNGKESLQAIEDILRAARAGPQQGLTWRILRKDKSLIDIEASIKSIEIKGELRYLITFRDITERKRAEEKLRESEQRFWTLVESAPVAVYETDAQGKCLFVNEKWRELAGMAIEDALGDGWQKRIYEEDRSRIFELWAEHGQSQEPWDMEYRFCTPDGRISWVVGRAATLRDADGKVTGYLGANLDITERKLAEEALRLSEKENRDLLEAIPYGVFESSMDGRITMTNPACSTITGYTREELLEMHVWELMAPGLQRDALSSWFENLILEQQDPTAYMGKARTEDGRLIDVKVDWVYKRNNAGEVIGVVFVLSDITEAKGAEEARRRSEELYRMLVERMHEGLGIIGIDGRIVYANTSLCKILGRSEDELVGCPIIDTVDQASRHIMEKQLVLRRDGIDAPYELLFIKPDGCRVPTVVSPAPLYSPDGCFLGSLVVITDISERIESERAIKESEEKYRAIFDHVVESIVLIDVETGRFLDFNNEAHMCLGYTREEFAELTIADVELIESPEEIATHINQVRKTGFNKFETKHRAKDGQERNVLISVKSVSLMGRELLVGLWHDVTEAKRAERRIAEQHRFLQDVIDSLSHPFFVVNSHDYTVKAANTACGPQSHSLGNTCYAMRHDRDEPCDFEGKQCPVRDVAVTGKPVTIERFHPNARDKRIYTQVNAYPLFDDKQNVSDVIIYSTDITDRKLAEEALIQSEEKFRTVIDQAGDALFLVQLNGRLVDVNRRACEVLGYRKEELLKLSVPDIDPVLSVDRFDKLLRNLRQKEPITIEAVHRRKDGSTFPVEIRVALVDVNGENHMLSLARDITHRKNNEAMIAASLEEKELLLKEIHHRVKNNLQVISSLLSIQNDHTDDQEIMSVLQASQSRVNSMALIHEQLYESSDFAEVNFPEYVQNLADRMMSSYGIDPGKVSFENELCGVSMDIDSAISLGLIVSELFSNALKHAFPDGRAGRICIKHSSDGNNCTLQVSDTGVGIASELDLTHPKSMGLRLVNMLAKQLGGSVKVETGDGTTVSVSYSQERA